MHRLTSAILALVMLAGGVAAWYLNRGEEVAGVDASRIPAIEKSGTVLSRQPVDSAPAVVEPGQPEPISPARRIRHGTAVPQDLSNAVLELPPSGNEKVDRLNARVERALDGEINELIKLSRLISDCRRGMDSEEQLEQRLDRMSRSQSGSPGGPSMPGRGGGSVEYRSFEELEADLWAQFDECQVAKEVLDESLYEQVCRLAETGLPSARYLYAVWPPNQDSFLEVDTLAMLEYQSLALEYTWLNMQERNPLGLLAMAQSYSARRPSMFTPSNGVQGQVFLLASMKCGVDNKWLSNRALNFGRGVSRFQAENTVMPSLDEDAMALAEKFCPQEAGNE